MDERKEKIIQNLVSQLQIPKEVWEEIKSRWKEFDLPGDPYLLQDLQITMLVALSGVEKDERTIEAFAERIKQADIIKKELRAKHGIKLPFSNDELLVTLLMYLILKNYLTQPEREEMKEEEIKEEAKRVHKLNSKLPEIMVIFCSDPRFKKATEGFIQHELGIESYIPIIVGGGIVHLFIEDTHPENYKFLTGQIELFTENFPNLRKVILVNHQDCKGYKEFYHLHDTDTIYQQKLDIINAVEFLQKIIKPDIGVEIYYATIEGEEVKFERIEEAQENAVAPKEEKETEIQKEPEESQVRCYGCKNQTPENSAVKCKDGECKKIFCPDCAEKHLDERGYCVKHTDEDIEECSRCEGEYISEKMKQCYECDGLYCPDCLSKNPELFRECRECRELFCKECAREHFFKCEVCETSLCKEQSDEYVCSKCKKTICGGCMKECDSCDNVYCENCAEEELDEDGNCPDCAE